MSINQKREDALDHCRVPDQAYLAGPMTGIDRWNFPAFDAVANLLLLDGWSVINPAETTRRFFGDPNEDYVPASADYPIFMRLDLRAVAESERIVFLPGWQDSHGARAEAFVARACGVAPWVALPETPRPGGRAWKILPVAADVFWNMNGVPQTLKGKVVVDQMTSCCAPDLSSQRVYGTKNVVLTKKSDIHVGSSTKAVKGDSTESVLAEADRLVSTDRQQDYGHPLDNFQDIANFWNVVIKSRAGQPIEAEHVALMMDLLKVSRELHVQKRDNRVDGPGYWKCLDLIIKERAERQLTSMEKGFVKTDKEGLPHV